MANVPAYGFLNLKDIYPSTVSENLPVVTAAIQQSIDEHNKQLDAIMGLFVEKTTDYQRQFMTPVLARLSGGDEYSRALPVKGASLYTIAFPLHKGQVATGLTYEAAMKLTVEQAAARMSAILTADTRWVRDHILAALFANVAWTHTDPRYGTLSIQGLANADAVTYQIMSGADAGATDTHYFAQSAAIAAGADPYPTIHDELIEHPENGGEVVAFIPTALKATTVALTSFMPAVDPNVQLGSASNVLVGDLGVQVPGKLIGYHDDGVWIVEWPGLPSTHIVAVTTDGVKPLCMRQETIPVLQGLQRVAKEESFPFQEDQYQRIAGFGANNRIGAAVYYIGNSSYAIPSGYESPMA